MHRYRITFMTGLAAGFVLGTRAGRERYEQMRKLARGVADNPAVQQAAGAMQAQATQTLTTARQKVTAGIQQRVPKIADGARHAVGDRMPGRRGRPDGTQNGASSAHRFAGADGNGSSSDS
jgi:hypothetical protein